MNKIKKVIVLGVLLSSMMNSVTQASNWDDTKVVAAGAAAVVGTLAVAYGAFSYLNSSDKKNHVNNDQKDSLEEIAKKQQDLGQSEDTVVPHEEKNKKAFELLGLVQDQGIYEANRQRKAQERKRAEQAEARRQERTWDKVDQGMVDDNL
jgi:hypothetical protein